MSKHRNHRKRMRHDVDHRRTPPGTPPGTLISDPSLPRPVVRVFSYGPEDYEELRIEDLTALKGLIGKRAVTWIDVEGLGDSESISQIGRMFDLHRLALEDVLNVHQRPKVDFFKDVMYIVSRMVKVEGGCVDTEQVSIFLGHNFVITFQERPGDCLNSIRERIRHKLGRVRVAGADYLAYALLDAIFDGYFPVLEDYGERLEAIEEEILERPEALTVHHIHDLKRQLMVLRRSMWPQREAINILARDPHPLITEETRIYLRDGYDHTIQILDLLETYRELGADLMDLYMNSVSTRMNEVMKVLTIIATIFIPLTLIAGIYGMNFDYMPELHWTLGYPFSILLMVLVTGGFLYYFRRRGWLGK